MNSPALGGLLILAWTLILSSLHAENTKPLHAEIAGKIVFVEASVNKAPPLLFIVDSGATETVITPATVRRLELIKARSQLPPKLKLASLQVGEVAVNNLSVFVYDPPQALPLRLDHGMDYCGILGHTFLSRFSVTLDYAAQTVQFATPSHKPTGDEPPQGSIRVEMQISKNAALVKGTLNGKGPFTFLLDTGSAEIVLMPQAAKQLGLQVLMSKPDAQVGFTTLNDIGIGDARVSNIQAVVLSALPRANSSSSPHDAIIGYPFLSNYRVTLDYPNRQLVLKPKPVDPPAVKSTLASQNTGRD